MIQRASNINPVLTYIYETPTRTPKWRTKARPSLHTPRKPNRCAGRCRGRCRVAADTVSSLGRAHGRQPSQTLLSMSPRTRSLQISKQRIGSQGLLCNLLPLLGKYRFSTKTFAFYSTDTGRVFFLFFSFLR